MSRDGVLLLGGAAFIGSALGKRLMQEDVPAHVIGRHERDRLGSVLRLCGAVIHDVRSAGLGVGHMQRELNWTAKIVLEEGVRRTGRRLRREAP